MLSEAETFQEQFGGKAITTEIADDDKNAERAKYHSFFNVVCTSTMKRR